MQLEPRRYPLKESASLQEPHLFWFSLSVRPHFFIQYLVELFIFEKCYAIKFFLTFLCNPYLPVEGGRYGFNCGCAWL